MTDLNLDGESHAHSMIAAGHVDKTSDWSFSANDGDKLLGASGDDWANYGHFHLGIDRAASENTKARFKYPFGKGGTLYRSALEAIRQRAGQQNDNAIETAAGKLLEAVDAMKAASMKPKNERVHPSIDAFRQAAKTATAPIADKIRASFDTAVKAGDAAARELIFTISTASVDRMGDTIAIDGWQLDAYRKNPVVLWAHDSGMHPMARAPSIWTESAKLMARTMFVPAEMPFIGPMAECTYQMYLQGFLSATSVGFMPLKYAFTDDPQRRYGIDFLEQELFEFSCVPVPANAEALVEGKSAGIDIVPLLDWSEDQLRRSGDSARIVKLADSVLGSSGNDMVALAWAGRIIEASGRSVAPPGAVVITQERANKIAELEVAATRERLRKARERDLEAVRMRSGV
jgi:HK97 family phage prohead protease